MLAVTPRPVSFDFAILAQRTEKTIFAFLFCPAVGRMGDMAASEKETIGAFRKMIWSFHAAGRREMPWRSSAFSSALLDPYSVMVSEVMLQQTQVARVLKKHGSFLQKFPTIASLAKASVSELLKEWQGMGYNRRALFLKRAAEEIHSKRGGKFPETIAELEELPGIGPATAAAIYVYSFNEPAAFIETNVRRVLLHHFFPRKKDVSDRELVPIAEAALDSENPREWHYALMDYGTFLKSQVENPNKRSRHYAKQSKFEGSNRQVRSRILKMILKEGSVKRKDLLRNFDPKGNDPRVEQNIAALEKEGFIKYDGKNIRAA